ncbi:MAG: hypothetical protein ACAH95_10235 [Fimbriimonas sp.]
MSRGRDKRVRVAMCLAVALLSLFMLCKGLLAGLPAYELVIFGALSLAASCGCLLVFKEGS